MLGVADSIFALGDVDGLVVHHLYVLPVQDAFLLLGHHVGYPRLSGIEVIVQFLHGVGLSGLFHGRHSDDGPGGVLGTSRIDRFRLDIVFHVVGCQLHVTVSYADIAGVIDHPLAVGEIFHDGVSRRCEGRLVK